jgi:hypothetical protein
VLPSTHRTQEGGSGTFPSQTALANRVRSSERERKKEEERTNKQKHKLTNKNFTSDISSVLSSSPRTQEGGGGTFPFRTALADGVRSSERESE